LAVGAVAAIRLSARSVLTIAAALARVVTRTRASAGVSVALALMPAGSLVAARPMVVLPLVMRSGIVARVLVGGRSTG
jgi:hypothetical protein